MPGTGFFEGARHQTIPQNGVSFRLRAFFSSLLAPGRPLRATWGNGGRRPNPNGVVASRFRVRAQQTDSPKDTAFP
jgi:hypothetical protein